jgi:hypothetical protein
VTFPVIVHPTAGQFEDTLMGSPEMRATAATREEALAKLESAISKRLDNGELVALDVHHPGLAGLFGKFRDDPKLREICADAYRERDAELLGTAARPPRPWLCWPAPWQRRDADLGLLLY